MIGLRARAVGELIRWPAALSVPGDSLAGATAAGWPFGGRTPLLGLSSACLYWAGMALNDYADREVDAAERPHRPVPSGRVSARSALGVAGALTGAGLGTAALAGGRRAVAVALPLASTIWAYDLGLKNTAAGPPAMAATRGLDVLLGVGAGRLRDAAPAAATMSLHTLAVTTLSRSEATGSRRVLPLATLTVTAAVPVLSSVAPRRGDSTRRWATIPAHCVYAGTFGRAQAAAVRDPSPARVQAAVAAGIHGMIPLQAALVSGAAPAHRPLARYGVAAAVLAALPVARRLSQRVSPT